VASIAALHIAAPFMLMAAAFVMIPSAMLAFKKFRF